MNDSAPWVEGPFKLISSKISGDAIGNRVQGTKKLASEMTIVHNVILRSINAIYNQALNVGAKGTEKDKADFVNFASVWGEMIHEHHETEEQMVFPDINRITGIEGLMDGNIAEHQQFTQGLTQYQEYIAEVKESREKYDGEKLVSIIDSFGPTMRDHLEHEIETLVRLDKYEDKCDWAKWFKKTIDAIVGNQMKNSRYRTDVFPLNVVSHDKTFEQGVWQNFPPAPWVVLFMLRWLFMRTRKDWWRFAGCDLMSNPKELPFGA